MYILRENLFKSLTYSWLVGAELEMENSKNWDANPKVFPDEKQKPSHTEHKQVYRSITLKKSAKC